MRILKKSEVDRIQSEEVANAKISENSYDNYNKALEDYLHEVNVSRGYTDREASDYDGSTVERWNSDAKIYKEFRDRVMLYGLEVLNNFNSGNEIPTLEEFKENLRKIEITWID